MNKREQERFGMPTARNLRPDVHEDKGKRNGRCNRAACQRPGATFYNPSTRAWYRPPCTHKINDANPGLCYVPGEGVDHG